MRTIQNFVELITAVLKRDAKTEKDVFEVTNVDLVAFRRPLCRCSEDPERRCTSLSEFSLYQIRGARKVGPFNYCPDCLVDELRDMDARPTLKFIRNEDLEYLMENCEPQNFLAELDKIYARNEKQFLAESAEAETKKREEAKLIKKPNVPLPALPTLQGRALPTSATLQASDFNELDISTQALERAPAQSSAASLAQEIEASSQTQALSIIEKQINALNIACGYHGRAPKLVDFNQAANELGYAMYRRVEINAHTIMIGKFTTLVNELKST